MVCRLPCPTFHKKFHMLTQDRLVYVLAATSAVLVLLIFVSFAYGEVRARSAFYVYSFEARYSSVEGTEVECTFLSRCDYIGDIISKYSQLSKENEAYINTLKNESRYTDRMIFSELTKSGVRVKLSYNYNVTLVVSALFGVVIAPILWFFFIIKFFDRVVHRRFGLRSTLGLVLLSLYFLLSIALLIYSMLCKTSFCFAYAIYIAYPGLLLFSLPGGHRGWLFPGLDGFQFFFALFLLNIFILYSIGLFIDKIRNRRRGSRD